MLKTELRNEIDNRWEGCWPVNTLRPLVIIDCICALLFFKKLQENKLIAGSFDQANGRAYYLNTYDELLWNNIKALDSKSLHDLFVKEDGIADLLKNYGITNLPYSNFLKAPLLINPSGVLLSNIVKIIEIIESQDACTRGSVFQYLLHKEEIHTTYGQVYIPPDMVSAMVSLVKPSDDEIIFDPACGNGDFFVGVAAYNQQKNSEENKEQLSKRMIGFDSDAVQLRIAAMNMMLHGIEDPCLLETDAMKEPGYMFPDKPAVILSNLFFANVVSNNNVTDTLPHAPETARKDITLLKSIMSNLKKGSRAAVIIRNYILNNNVSQEIIAIRKQLIEDYKIDAVINLPDKTGAVSSDASILIFHLTENENNEKIWFYKMKQAPNIFEDISETDNQFANEDAALAHVQMKSQTANHKSKAEKIILSENFFVTGQEIRRNFFNLGYSQYKKNTLPSVAISGNDIPEAILLEEPPVKDQHLSNTWSGLRLKASALQKTALHFLIKSKAFINDKKASIKSEKFNAAVSLLLVKAKTLFNKSKLEVKNLAVNTSKFLTNTWNAFIKNKPKAKVLKLNTNASQLLANAQISFKKKVSGQKVFALNINASQGLLKAQNSFNKITLRAKEILLNRSKRIFLISMTTLGFVIMGFLLIHKSKDNKDVIPAKDNAVVSVPVKSDNVTKSIVNKKLKRTLTKQQLNSILKDTMGIIRDDNNITLNSNLKSASPKKSGLEKIKYIVKDTTYFHDEPVESAARKSYLDPLRKSVLTPLQDSNGYIYIVYTNRFNITSKGWINKRSLQPVH